MQKYLNSSGNSGILSFHIGKDFIDVRFSTDPDVTYRYSSESSNSKHIETMKQLAIKGHGLSTYIAQHPEVRDHYKKR